MQKSRILDAMARHVWALLAAVPSLVVMRGMFSTDRLYCLRDIAGYYWPEHLWHRRMLVAGESTLWDPYVAFGQSALADPTRHLMFPPVLLLRFVPNEVLGFNLVCGLPFPIAAVGMYALLRRRLSGPASAFGAAAFSVCAPVLSTGSMIDMSWAVAILPWLVLAFARLADRATGGRFATAAALGGGQTGAVAAAGRCWVHRSFLPAAYCPAFEACPMLPSS